MARGHRIGETPEGPLIVSSAVEATTKTAAAVAMLKKLGAYADVEKVQGSRTMRAGKGKMRNRRFVQRRGPLIVYGTDSGLTRAFRNIPGVELADVSRLNLLQLAPGGHVGRFCIWTEGAVAKLDAIFGTATAASTTRVHNGTPARLPSAMMTNSDLSRIINSDEVQSKINAPKEGHAGKVLKANPLRNKDAMDALNPAAATQKKRARDEQKANEGKKKSRKSPGKEVAARKKAYYRSMVAEE